MGAKPGFDMRDRDGRGFRRKRAAQRAGRVALHDHQIGWFAVQMVEHRLVDLSGMDVRVFEPGAGKSNRRVTGEAIVERIELRMLARKDEEWRKPARAQRVDDGGKLDCFGTSADDDGNATGQPSP